LRQLLLYRALRLAFRRARERAKREREREQRLRASVKADRDRADPNNLAAHEAAWWPLVRSLQPDIVHAHDISGLTTARRAARHGVRWIYDAHEPKRHFHEEGSADASRTQVTEHASHADAVISTTSALAELLVRELGLSRA